MLSSYHRHGPNLMISRWWISLVASLRRELKRLFCDGNRVKMEETDKDEMNLMIESY